MVHMTGINRYYSPDNLYDRILDGLARLGREPTCVSLDDLQSVDEFHIRGSFATFELIELAEFDEGMHVLDIGCGVGGASRRLASEAECRVTGVDLSTEYIRTAQSLTTLLDMDEQLDFHTGDALNLPFENNAFDGAWSIQVNMNIERKLDWLKEVYRVLKPGARFVLYEVCAGRGGSIHLPVPWAQDETMSYLVSQLEFQKAIVEAGFGIETWEDKTADAIQAFGHRPLPEKNTALPPLGVHLLVGDDILTKAYNLHQNFEEQRVTLLQAVVYINK